MEFRKTTRDGLPLYHVTKDGGYLCAECANKHHSLCTDPDNDQWYVVASEVNWAQHDLSCDHCYKFIHPAN